MSSLRYQMRYLNPYEKHKLIINEYVLKKPGDTKLLQDTPKGRTDYDVLKDNHKFLWDCEPQTWEQKFAKTYYEKLFKEYCIADLTRYKENKFALRWRIEREVVSGKGQFVCGNKHCSDEEQLRSWEINFAYQEDGQKKNALVKVRLCPSCSKKLNYHCKKREVKRLKRRSGHKSEDKCNTDNSEKATVEVKASSSNEETEKVKPDSVEAPWDEYHKPEKAKTVEEEMEDYLNDLLI